MSVPRPIRSGIRWRSLYNPVDPEQYYIPHSSGGNWVFVLGGVFFFCMGAFFAVQVLQAWLLPLLAGKLIGYPFFFIGSTKE